jgi:hypothetical protein
MSAPVGEHSIIPCTKGCGAYVRPTRMDEATAEKIGTEKYGPDAVVRVNTGKGICSPCRRYPSQQVTAKTPEQLAAEEERRERLAAERIAAAHKAREVLEAQRQARQAAAGRRKLAAEILKQRGLVRS